MIDPEAPKEIAKAGGEIAKLGQEGFAFLGRILGTDTARELDKFLAQEVAFVGFKRSLAIGGKAARLLKARGVEPVKVPTSVAGPLLSAASWEEDEGMQERWAALLATAADPANAGRIPPSFPRILAELSPLETMLLQRLYDRMEAASRAGHVSDGGPDVYWNDLVRPDTQLAGCEPEVITGNWLRLNLVSRPIELDAHEKTGTQAAYDHKWEGNYMPRAQREDFPIRLTTLAVRFLEACQPLRPQEPA